jgi:glycosyltransferase involved in cell wall biosynthesis
MTKQPLVSVLMPAFNAEKFIAEAIDSIVGQSHQNWELLILDDASTDETLSIINSFADSRIKVLRNETNQGYLLSCNRLFSEAKGDFITFQDADDTCNPDRLTTCLGQFAIQPELNFLTTSFRKRRTINQVGIDYSIYAHDSNFLPTICGATLFFRNRLLKQVPGYRHVFDCIGGEDYYFIWELSKVGVGKHLGNPLYHYRVHPDQLSKDISNPLRLFMSNILLRLRIEFSEREYDHETAIGILKMVKLEIEKEPVLVLFKLIEKSINEGQFISASILWLQSLLGFKPKNFRNQVILGITILNRWVIFTKG